MKKRVQLVLITPQYAGEHRVWMAEVTHQWGRGVGLAYEHEGYKLALKRAQETADNGGIRIWL